MRLCLLLTITCVLVADRATAGVLPKELIHRQRSHHPHYPPNQSAIRWKRSWNDEVERAESRNFIDIWPYLGDFIYRGMIRRMLIQPMLGGARKIVPGRIFAYYHNISSKYADNRVYKMVSPLEPALSSYVNNKFEQGVFWGLKKSFDVFVDNFVEFVKKKK